MKKGQIKYVFPGGNTAKGFHSFYEEGLTEMERVFIIKGGPGTGKSTLMRKIGLAMVERGRDVEFWCCSSDNGSLDGVIIPDFKVAVIDGTAPHVVDPKYPGAVDEIVYLGEHWNETILKESREEIKGLTREISDSFAAAYKYLGEAKAVQDEWRSFYAEGLDTALADEKAAQVIKAIFSPEPPKVRRRFASAITPKGPVDYVNNLTEECKTRFIIRGNPGTGKTVLLSKVVDTGLKSGHDMDIYYCALQPNEIHMVVLPRLGVAVINDYPPFMVDADRPGDRIVNMMECVVKETAEVKSELEEVFNQLINNAISNIAKAKELHDDLERYYIKAMDFAAVEAAGRRVTEKILSISNGAE